jgi:Zn-dependent peptidase ImmA (M78 family)
VAEFNISERLKSARLALKLTLEAASERSGIGVSTLSAFENGHREPRLGQLAELAKAYHCSVSSFLDDELTAAPGVLWRQRPPSPNAEELQATLLSLAEQYRTLEILCEQHTVIELPAVPAREVEFSYPAAASLARRVRNELGLGDRPGQTLLRVLEEVCHVKVFHLEFDPSGSAACTVSARLGAAILLNSKNVRWRRNFDLAHELFHLLTWQVFRHDAASQIDQPSEHEEKLATCFARNLLMPEEVFRESADALRSDSGRIDFDGLFEVAREFDVSVEAVVWQLGFVYQIPTEKLQPTVNSLRGRAGAWEVRDYDVPPRRPLRFEALARQALRKGLISTGRFAEYVGISRREAMKFVEQDALEDVQVEVAHP